MVRVEACAIGLFVRGTCDTGPRKRSVEAMIMVKLRRSFRKIEGIIDRNDFLWRQTFVLLLPKRPFARFLSDGAENGQ